MQEIKIKCDEKSTTAKFENKKISISSNEENSDFSIQFRSKNDTKESKNFSVINDKKIKIESFDIDETSLIALYLCISNELNQRGIQLSEK